MGVTRDGTLLGRGNGSSGMATAPRGAGRLSHALTQVCEPPAGRVKSPPPPQEARPTGIPPPPQQPRRRGPESPPPPPPLRVRPSPS